MRIVKAHDYDLTGDLVDQPLPVARHSQSREALIQLV